MAKNRKRVIKSQTTINADLSAHALWVRDIQSLQQTLYRIKNVSPAMGEKWKSGMINYFEGRITELAQSEPQD